MVIRSFISPQDIEKEAIKFLNLYHPESSIPVPIEEIVEIKLKIQIIPSPRLRRDYGIDGFSTQNFKEIHIDHNQFFDMENRVRFTLAREIGHYEL